MSNTFHKRELIRLKVILTITDLIFSMERIMTWLCSGFIGITLIAMTDESMVEDQNKFLFILVGWPIWAFVRGIYWPIRIQRFPDVHTRHRTYREYRHY